MSNVSPNYGIIGAVNAKQVAVGEHAHAVYVENSGSREVSRLTVPLDEIDSFQKVREVPVSAVQGFPYPLQVPEVVIKHLIARIIGEPFVPKDWGGEMDDLLTSRVQYNGRRVTTRRRPASPNDCSRSCAS